MEWIGDPVNSVTSPVKHITPNIVYTVFYKTNPDLAIFCWNGEEKSLLSFWKTATVIYSVNWLLSNFVDMKNEK